MMNTFQLAQVLTKDPFTKGSFAGVYACDELSSIKISKYPKSFVVNTDPMELPGDIFYLTHYVFTVFKKYTKYRIMLKIVKYDLKKCIKNTIMIKYNKILRNKLFTKPRSLKLM